MAQDATTGQQQQQTTTLAQKTEMVAGVAMFFMLPIVVFLRRKAGYRFLNPTRVFAMALIVFCYGQITTIVAFNNANSAAQQSQSQYTQTVDGQAISDATQQMIGAGISTVILSIFALLVVVFALFQRSRRWKEITHGVPWHTYSRGISWFSFLPLADNKIKRFVDPAVVAIIGLICTFLFHLNYLGYYLLFSAACLFIFEAWDYEQNLNKMLDTLDSLVDSEVMSQNVEYYSQPNPKQRPISETAGIPTGIAADIQHQIERRKHRAPTLSDDLVIHPPVQRQPDIAI